MHRQTHQPDHNITVNSKKTCVYFVIKCVPFLSHLGIRWASRQDARDSIWGLWPGNEELDTLSMHPEPQGLLQLRRDWACLLQPRWPAATWPSQLLLQTTLRLHCGGVRLWAGWVMLISSLYTCKHEPWQHCGKEALKAVYGALFFRAVQSKSKNKLLWSMENVSMR